MSITSGAYKNSLEKTLLRLLAKDIKRMKYYRKHLQHIRQSTKIIDAELMRVRDVVLQIHILQIERKKTNRQEAK